MTDEIIVEKQKILAEIAVLQREYSGLLEQDKTIQAKKDDTEKSILSKFRKLTNLESGGLKKYLDKFKNSMNLV